MAKDDEATGAKKSNTGLKVGLGILILIILGLGYFAYTTHVSLVNTQETLNSANQTISNDNGQINNLDNQVSNLQSEYSGLESQNTQLQNELAAQGISETPVPHSETLFTQGQVFSIGPNAQYGYEYSEFSTPSTATGISVSGSYTSQGSVEVAILTATQYGAFEADHSSLASDNTYYYGDTQGSSISATLSPGTYYLVFYDPGVFTTDTVSIVNPVVFSYTS